MRPSPPMVALDLGSTKVACAIGQAHEQGAWQLLGTSVISYPVVWEGWLGDLLLVSRTIEQAIEAAGVPGDLHRARVALTHPALLSEQVRVSILLGDEPVRIRNHDLERLQAMAVDRVLGVDREPLHVAALSYTGNGFADIRDPRGLAATRLFGTFHILTLPLAARRAVVQSVEGAGLEVEQLCYGLSAGLACLPEGMRSHQRVLVVDLSGHNSDLAVFAEGSLEAAVVIPGGGVQLAGRIASTFQITLDQAVAWSLEGTACRKPEVRDLVTAHWAALEQPLAQLLAGRPKPNLALAGGRAALVDGFVEWLERTTGMPVQLCRSSKTQGSEDMPRQVGLSGAIGLLDLAFEQPDEAPSSGRFFNRLVDGTKQLLTEYF